MVIAMNKTLLKDTFREIRKSFGRFISVFGISLIGVAFFAGVKASAPYMKNSVDTYYDDRNFMDLKLLSTVGLSDDDVEAAAEIEGIESVQGAYKINALSSYESREYIFELMSYEEEMLNNLELTEGRLPENDGEIVLRDYSTIRDNYEIGDTIEFYLDDDNDIEDSLSMSEYTIVGFAKTPYYFSFEYDSSSVGNGSVDYVGFIPIEDFVSDTYTVMYASVEGGKSLGTYDDEYFDTVEPVKEQLEELGEKRSEDLYKELCTQAESLYGSSEMVPKVEWYVLDRNSHYSYVSYGNCADRMNAIAKVFPVFFFLVAALVCLTTMTRMVDEQRGEIGTLKALGYGKLSIAMKFIIYAFTASITGGLAGCFVGLKVFPTVIFYAWSTVYDVGSLTPNSQLTLCITAVVLTVLVILAATIVACINELVETPSILLRPKAPKQGKKILLERITPIWKRFSFSNKVTARNIFRYKKRFFMTVIGISGCTALLCAGFGIKDSVLEIVNSQYGKIFTYNIEGSFSAASTEEDKEGIIDEYRGSEAVDDIMLVTQHAYTANSEPVKDSASEKNITFISVDEKELERYSSFVHIFQNDTNNELIIPEQGALITYKMAKDFDVEKGDYIYVSDGDEFFEVEVADIISIYVGQYVFMSDEYYEEITGESAAHNSFIVLNSDSITTEEQEHELGEAMVDNYNLDSILYYDGVQSNFEDMMGSLDLVTVVIIIAAALLAFVVLYNLINVNISERIREIATIKVLGFYDKEVTSYVFRENIVLTVIGAAVGLLLGKALHSYIMAVIEMDDIIFPQVIRPSSYFLAIGMTIAFGIIVSLFMSHKLKKIPMVESLKFVE